MNRDIDLFRSLRKKRLRVLIDNFMARSPVENRRQRITVQFLRLRNGNNKFGPFAEDTCYRNGTALNLGKLLGDRESKTGSAVFSRAGRIDPVKTVEESCEIILRDAHSVVGNLHGNIVIRQLDRNADIAAHIRVLDAVRHKVGDDAVDGRRVTENRRND